MQSIITRRQFISKISKCCLGSSLFLLSGSIYSCSKTKVIHNRYKNLFSVDGKPLLIIVRGDNPSRMVEKGLSVLLESSDKPLNINKLYIKPNATGNEPYPVTTDVRLLSSLVEYFKKYGSNEILIGDNPSYRGIYIKRIFKDLGYLDLIPEYNIRVLPNDPGIGYSYSKVHNDNWSSNPVIMVNKEILGADLVINTAIPKRHHEADFTCALKNNFGSVYDTMRTQAHIRMEIDKKNGQQFFDRTVIECADAVRPQINIVDARSILIKSGPGIRSGGVVLDGISEMIMSGDMVAVDAYCSDLMQRNDPSYSPGDRVKYQLEYAETLGLGIADPTKFELVEINL